MRIEQFTRPFRDENRLDLAELRDHMLATYFNLRIATGSTALLFPLVLWSGRFFSPDERLDTLRRSLSAYYHTDMQEIFIGVLLFVGVILVLYRGYSDLENRVLNVAGVLLWGVALLPVSVEESVAVRAEAEVFTAPVPHGVCAVGFFLCIAYVCIWRSRDTLDYVASPSMQQRYRMIYRALGSLMVVLPTLAAVLLYVLEPTRLVFWVEFMAVWVFGTYWIVKSVEINRSSLSRPS